MNLYNYFWTNLSVKRNELTAKYEPVQPFLFISLINELKCELVFDIGANIGFYSLLSSLCKTVESIYAFEAVPEPYREMLKNVEMNVLQEKISCHNVAVSNKIANLTFLIHSDPLSGINASKDSTFHDKSKYSSELEVKAITLDGFLDIEGKSIAIKIDVEGHELSVLEGAEKLLRKNRCFVQVECFSQNKIKLIEEFGRMGYHNFYELYNDLYFSNELCLKQCENISKVVKDSLDLLIKNKLGKFPEKTSRDSLVYGSVKMLSDRVIEANLFADKSFFADDIEYAFYLLIDGVKREASWYKEQNSIKFSIPLDVNINQVSIKGFIRDRIYHDKKFSLVMRLSA